MSKTESAAYQTQREKWQAIPQAILRFYHVPDFSKADGFAFSRDFCSGTITSPSSANPFRCIGTISGNTQTVVPHEGRSSAGAFTATLIDLGGEVLRYLSVPALTLNANITDTVPGAGAYLVFAEPEADVGGLPSVGTVEVTTGGVIERIRYDLLDAANSRVRVATSGRGVDGTTAAAHTAGDPATNGEQIRQGQRVRLYLGYEGLAQAEFMAFLQWDVTGRRAGDAGLAWQVTCQDMQRLLDKTVFLDWTPEKPGRAKSDPITMLLWFLLSTGTGANGPYDVLGEDDALGLPAAAVDVAAFEALRTSDFSGETFDLSVTGPTSGKQFAEEQFFKVLGCYPFVKQDGTYSVKKYRPALAPGAVVNVLDETDILDFQGPEDGPIINEVVLEYDFDLPSKPNAYGLRVRYLANDSITKYGRRRPFVVSSQAVRTASGAADILDRLALDVGRRFATTLPVQVLRVTVPYRRHTLDIGDLVKLRHTQIPNPANGRRGVYDAVFEIVDMSPDFLMQGRLTLTLMWTGILPAFEAGDLEDRPAQDLAPEGLSQAVAWQGGWASGASYVPGDWVRGVPNAPSVAAGGAGNVNVGLHSWRITWVSAAGQTHPGIISAQLDITSTAKQVNLTAVQVGPPGTIARNIWRTVAGDTGKYRYVGQIGDNTTTTFTDDVADSALGVNAPVSGTFGVGNTYVAKSTHTAGASTEPNVGGSWATVWWRMVGRTDRDLGQVPVQWSIQGTISTGPKPFRWRPQIPMRLRTFTLTVGDAPTGADLIVDIHKGGTTIFTTQANRPRIVDGATVGISGEIELDGGYITPDEYLEFEVDQVGSTTPGADLAVLGAA